MNKFSELALMELNKNGGYYVYGLIDPRNNKIFYIGKGTENRIFQHIIESNKNPESEKLKLKKIKEIEDAGYHVEHVLINYNLSESEAFASEATLINMINYIPEYSLCNIVSGHHSKGCIKAERFEKIFGAQQLALDDVKHRVLVIKVNKSFNYNMKNEEVYNIVRGLWRARLERAKKTDYVFAVFNNLIVGCFKPDRWFKLSDKTKHRAESMIGDKYEQLKGRIFFESDYINTFDENQRFYLYKSIKDLEYIQRSQNPIIYIGF